MKTQIVKQAETAQNNVITDESKRIIYKSCLSALMIVAISILVNLSIRLDYVVLGSSLGEVSITETLQVIMLAIASWSFFQLSKQEEQVKPRRYFDFRLLRGVDHSRTGLLDGYDPSRIVGIPCVNRHCSGLRKSLPRW